MYDNVKYKSTPLEQPVLIADQVWIKEMIPVVNISCITYNHVNFIRDAIEGFLIQKTTFPVEILIHDDASTDGTTEIIKEYEAKYPNLFNCFYETENTWNKPNRHEIWKPFREARSGKYIALCEGDDYWTDPLKLQKQVDFLEANGDYVICYHDFSVVDANGNLIMETQLSDNDRKDASSEDLVCCNIWIKTLTLCFRNLINDTPFESKYILNGDNFLVSRLGLYGKGKWMGDSISPGVYRMHTNSVWSSISDIEKQAAHLNTFFWISQYYKRMGEPIYAIKWHEKLKRKIYEIGNEELIYMEEYDYQLSLLRNEITNLKKSFTYRVGQIILFPFIYCKVIISKFIK